MGREAEEALSLGGTLPPGGGPGDAGPIEATEALGMGVGNGPLTGLLTLTLGQIGPLLLRVWGSSWVGSLVLLTLPLTLYVGWGWEALLI